MLLCCVIARTALVGDIAVAQYEDDCTTNTTNLKDLYLLSSSFYQPIRPTGYTSIVVNDI